MKSKKSLIITILLVGSAIAIFYTVSQMYPADEQIFITDSYFISPKTQSLQFVLMWFVNVGLMLFAVWVGKLIAVFLWAKGILFRVVGAGLVLGSGVLGYNFLVLQERVRTTKDLVIVLVLVLFVGGLGVLMLFSNLINKKGSFEN